MFPILSLTPEQEKLCQKIISSNTFYMLVSSALKQKSPLSVVRMADGEYHLLSQAGDLDSPVDTFPNIRPDWLKWLGIEGISRREVRYRLFRAATKSTYFAPSICGVLLKDWNLYDFFPTRDRYVDNFFVNSWTEEMKIKLYKEAKHILFIHHNPNTADSLQLRLQGNIGVKVSFIRMSNWKETESVIEKAKKIDAPLVLLSAGPGGKYIIPEISTTGNIPKVCLDLGNAADHWVPKTLPVNRKLAEKFHAEWAKNRKSS